MLVHEEWRLTPQRLAVHVPTATGVLADLHLGYHQARRQGGDAVPDVALPAILAPLEGALRAHGVRQVIIAGDLFEKSFVTPLLVRLRSWLADRGVALSAIVPGNHDRGWDKADAPFFPDGVRLGRWLVVHGDVKTEAPHTVLGHWHPAIAHRGRLCPCYLVHAGQIVLPAFSQEAAGANVVSHFALRGHRCVVIAGGGLVDVGVVPAGGKPSAARRKRSRPWLGRLRPG